MRTYLLGVLVFTGILVAACGGGDQTAAEEVSVFAQPEGGRPFVVADFGDDVAKKTKRFQPLADYLALELKEFGFTHGEVRIAPDLTTLVEWMKAGDVQLYLDSLYPSMIAVDEAGAVPILRSWKDGVAEYHTVFFALSESGLTGIDDLAGRTLALDEPVSTSGFLVPVAYLASLNIPVHDGALGASANSVSYQFSFDDENTIQWVINGRTQAGVVDSETFKEIPEATRAQMVVLAETDPVPRPLALAGPNLEQGLVDQLTALLLGLQDTPDGEEISRR